MRTWCAPYSCRDSTRCEEGAGIPAIFLSYRRADTSGYAGRLAAALAAQLGPEKDVEAIAPGSDFSTVIDAAVARCQVMLVLIGDTWLFERDAQDARRLDDPRDYVRLEIRAALRRATPVLPVLLEGAAMPSASELPGDLAALARFQAIEISDTRWDYDVNRLVAAIARLTGASPQRSRRRVLVAALAGAASLAVLAGALLLPERVPDVSGRWELPDGSWWVVVQDAEQLVIEEVHHQTREVWLRGSGRIAGERILVELDAVFDRGSARGHVDVARGGEVLRGELQMLPRGVRGSLLLTRAQ